MSVVQLPRNGYAYAEQLEVLRMKGIKDVLSKYPLRIIIPKSLYYHILVDIFRDNRVSEPTEWICKAWSGRDIGVRVTYETRKRFGKVMPYPFLEFMGIEGNIREISADKDLMRMKKRHIVLRSGTGYTVIFFLEGEV